MERVSLGGFIIQPSGIILRMAIVRRWVGFSLLIVSILVLLWGLWPIDPEVRTIPITSSDIAGPEASAPGGAIEQRLLVLEWPDRIRVGDAQVIRLSLDVEDGNDLAETPKSPSDQVRSESVEIPGIYETHHVLAEARLDMAGMEYLPSGKITEALLPGKPAIFLWSVRPNQLGAYEGTVWLHLRLIPKSGGEETRQVLSAQIIAIEAVNFLGLGGAGARVFGAVGVALGSILSLDRIIKWFFGLFTNRKEK